MMNFLKAVAAFIAFAGMTALAQTTVTTSGGTANTVPLYTGSSTLGNSVITQSGGNVGVGTTDSPDSLLEIGNPNVGNGFHSVVGGGYAGLFENAYTGFGGQAKLLWVESVNQNPDSYHFFVQDNGNPELVVQGNGHVGIGTSSPSAPLNIASGIISNNGEVFNALTLQPGGGSAYSANGSSILLEAVTNDGTQPVAGVWSSLGSGGDGGVNYNGSLVFGSTPQGSATPVEHMRLDPNGNLGIGIANPGAKLEINGNLKLTSGSGASITFADGTVQSTAYTGVSCGGDYAESVDVKGKRAGYEPGDLLVISGTDGSDVEKSSEPYSTMVAGIYSTKPGYVGRRQTTQDKTREIPMAMVGIVPTKVSAENGPIHRGDLLVTSSTPGYVMKGTDRARMLGAVVGKAMGNLSSGKGVMEVLVTLQ